MTERQPVAVALLASLLDGPRHGYAALTWMREVARLEVNLSTLYRTLRRLLEADLIVEVDAPTASPSDDPRRRYWALTPAGCQAIQQEAQRLYHLSQTALTSLAHTLDKPHTPG